MKKIELVSANEVLFVECSPRTATMVKTDAAFREEIFQNSYNDSQTEDCGDFIRLNSPDATIPCNSSTDAVNATITSDIINADNTNTSDKAVWLEKDTKLLIELYRELKPSLGKTIRCKTKKRMWRNIQERLEMHGVFYTALQIESKWRSLERGFKNKIKHNNKSGRDKRQVDFDSELTEILIERDNVIPQFTLDASSSQGQNVTTTSNSENLTITSNSLTDALNASYNTINATITSDIINANNTNTSDKAVWLEKDTKLLIKLYRELKPSLGKSIRCKTKKRMWRNIQERLEMHGVFYTALQIESKWRNLGRGFKNKIKHNNKAGRDKQVDFDSELAEILIDRDNVIPQFTLDASSSEGQTREEVLSNYSLASSINNETNIEKEVLPERKKKCKTIVEELTMIRALREKIAEKKSVERGKEKMAFLEAYKERTAAIKEKAAAQAAHNKLLLELLRETQNK